MEALQLAESIRSSVAVLASLSRGSELESGDASSLIVALTVIVGRSSRILLGPHAGSRSRPKTLTGHRSCLPIGNVPSSAPFMYAECIVFRYSLCLISRSHFRRLARPRCEARDVLVAGIGCPPFRTEARSSSRWYRSSSYFCSFGGWWLETRRGGGRLRRVFPCPFHG